MIAQRDPSVEQLRRESERTRAQLTSTLAELREKVSDTTDDLKARLSPAHIKQDVKDYVREGSEQFVHSIKRKARENPLQAVAIGAGLAYPLLGILKSIPVPGLLIGAGLWLTRQKPAGGNSFATEMAGKVREAGAEGLNAITESARVAHTALAAGADSVTDKVRATTQDISGRVTEMGQAVVGTVQDATANTTESLSATVSDLSNKVTDAGRRSRTALQDLVERNPLAVAAAGLALGAVIAASLPSSVAENRMFGERSDDLKDKALEAVSQGVERVKDVAAGMADDVAAAAARGGLDAEGIGKSIQGLTESVKSVVDRGLTTALGDGTPAKTQDNFQTNKS